MLIGDDLLPFFPAQPILHDIIRGIFIGAMVAHGLISVIAILHMLVDFIPC